MRKLSHFPVILAIAALALITGPAAGSLAAPPTTQWVTPLEINFGSIGLGQAAPTMQVTITNTGDNPLTDWAGGGLSAPFNASQDCNITGGILPGRSCHYFFTFSPTTAGNFTATSTSTTNAGNFSVIVHGTGVGAQASYDAHALDFGSLFSTGRFPAVAPTQVVTIKNTGMAPLTGWAGGGLSAPFNASQDCNVTGGILPGNTCHYFFSFSASGPGSSTATSSSTTNGGPVDVTLTGAIHPLLLGNFQAATPRSLDFGPVGIGQTAQLVMTVTNQSGQNNITSWAGGGVGAPFNASQDCASASGLAPGASCHFFYTFSPTAPGPFQATSTITDTFGTFSIDLQGTGLAPSLKADALWLDFGPVLIGQTGPTQQITLTNTGASPITGWAGGGVGAPFNASQDCVISGGLLPGKSCHFFYTFSPTAAGVYSATSSFSTNAGAINIKLQGQGSTTTPVTTPYNLFLPTVGR